MMQAGVPLLYGTTYSVELDRSGKENQSMMKYLLLFSLQARMSTFDPQGLQYVPVVLPRTRVCTRGSSLDIYILTVTDVNGLIESLFALRGLQK